MRVLPLSVVAMSLSLFAACAVAPIVEDGRVGTPAAARAADAPVVVGGSDQARKRLDDAAIAACGTVSPALHDALVADAKQIDWEKTDVFTAGRLHFVGEVVVRRAKNDHAPLDEAAAIAAAEEHARRLGANLIYERTVKREGRDDSSMHVAQIAYYAYAIDCAAAPATP